jgi:putative ABC transport system permease protein
MSFSVNQRAREIGIRMALGAGRPNILLMVLREGVVLVAAGLGIGLTIALAAANAIKALLLNVSARDPLTFAVVPLLLAGVALLATYVPARRATRVDPLVALRYE